MENSKKNVVVKLLILTVFVFFNFSCGIKPQVSKVTISNYSGNEVTNLKLFYVHGNDGNKTHSITSIKNDFTERFSIEIASNSWNTYVGRAKIEYQIGEKTFDRLKDLICTD